MKSTMLLNQFTPDYVNNTAAFQKHYASYFMILSHPDHWWSIWDWYRTE